MTFTLSVHFSNQNLLLQNYSNKEKITKHFKLQEFTKEYKLGDKISLPFFSGTIIPNPDIKVVPNKNYYLKYNDLMLL